MRLPDDVKVWQELKFGTRGAATHFKPSCHFRCREVSTYLTGSQIILFFPIVFKRLNLVTDPASLIFKYVSSKITQFSPTF